MPGRDGVEEEVSSTSLSCSSINPSSSELRGLLSLSCSSKTLGIEEVDSYFKIKSSKIKRKYINVVECKVGLCKVMNWLDMCIVCVLVMLCYVVIIPTKFFIEPSNDTRQVILQFGKFCVVSTQDNFHVVKKGT